jgi:hypothetical protein
VVPGSPADFGKLIVNETEKRAKVVKFSGGGELIRKADGLSLREERSNRIRARHASRGSGAAGCA